VSSSASVCDSVCLFIYPHDNSKLSNPKVFKLGIDNDLEIAYRFYDLGSKGQRSRLGLELGLQKHIEGDRVACVSTLQGGPKSGTPYLFCSITLVMYTNWQFLQ